MSFKREGDDLSLLNKLKNHRVSELLGTHIPEDEAKLLSNGRLTCLICSFRPIFDTIPMLAKHRKGKKHLLELSKFIKRREELEFESLKKAQLEAVKQKAIEASCRLSASSVTLGPKPDVDYKSLASLRTGRKKTIEVPVLFNSSPLSVKCVENSPTSQLRRYIKGLQRKRSLGKIVLSKKEGYISREQIDPEDKIVTIEAVTSEKFMKSTTNASKEIPSQCDLQKNLSGWIKDKSGSWVKDPEAEFDSDE